MLRVLILLTALSVNAQVIMIAAKKAPPPSGITVITSGKCQATNNNSCTTGDEDATGGNLTYVLVSLYSANSDPSPLVSSVTTSGGDTCTLEREDYQSVGWTAINTLFYRCSGGTYDSTHSASVTANGTFPSVAFVVLSGAVTTGIDQDIGLGIGLQTGIDQDGGFTPSQNDEIVLVGLSTSYAGGTASIDSGFTIAQSTANVTGVGIALAYIIQTTATAVNPVWTVGGASALTTSMISVAKQ